MLKILGKLQRKDYLKIAAIVAKRKFDTEPYDSFAEYNSIAMFSESEKNFYDLKCTLKTVDFFPSCKNEIRVSFFNRIFCNTTRYFLLVKRFVLLQFC